MADPSISVCLAMTLVTGLVSAISRPPPKREMTRGENEIQNNASIIRKRERRERKDLLGNYFENHHRDGKFKDASHVRKIAQLEKRPSPTVFA